MWYHNTEREKRVFDWGQAASGAWNNWSSDSPLKSINAFSVLFYLRGEAPSKIFCDCHTDQNYSAGLNAIA